MFKKSFHQKDRVSKIRKPSKRSFRDDAKQKLREQLVLAQGPPSAGNSPQMNSDVVSMFIGKDRRLFACHEHVIRQSSWFARICDAQAFNPDGIRIELPDEEPQTFSAVLEFLYHGDYSPRLLLDKKRNTWMIEDETECPTPRTDGGRFSIASSTIYRHELGETVLRDTVIYCSAERYHLDTLKRLALRKQGLQTGIDCATILRSARYAYEHTSDEDCRLRAHYLAMIVRGRKVFKRSGTMQMEMQIGGKLFFDLFVAMCNHIDDLDEFSRRPTPRID